MSRRWRDPDIITMDRRWVDALGKGEITKNIGGDWVPARPEGYPSILVRIQAAWLVFTGRADALIWPGGQ